MSDSVLERFTGTRSEELANDSRACDAGPPDNLGAFGYLRGIRDRAVMLELQRRDGSIMAIGYSWLERVEYDPSDGITLSASGRRIRIRGRNLNVVDRPQVQLFQAIVRHRITWIREGTNDEHMTTDEHLTIIESIEW